MLREVSSVSGKTEVQRDSLGTQSKWVSNLEIHFSFNLSSLELKQTKKTFIEETLFCPIMDQRSC